MKKSNTRYSIYTTLAVVIFTAVVVIMSINSRYRYMQMKDKIVKEMRESSAFTIDVLEKNIANLIDSYAVNEYENLILNEMIHSDNFAIIVKDYNMGKMLGKEAYISGSILDSSRNIVSYDFKNSEHNKSLERCYYSDGHDIKNSAGERVGNVTVYISNYEMSRELDAIIVRNIINTAVISLLLILSLFIAIRLFILKPLSNIIKVIHHSDEDGIPVDLIDTHGSREIYSLISTMNSMIESIRDSRVKHREQKNELELYKNNLEELVIVKTEELKKTQERIMQTEKMTALGGMVAGVAHEINTPIGLSITSMTHFVAMTKELQELYRDENMSEEDFEEYMDASLRLANITYENLNRAAKLIQSFKQVSVDQTNEEQRTFDLKNYIEKTLLSLHNITKQRKIKIKVNSKDDVSIYSYPGAYAQIVTNLITNSLTHGFAKDELGTINIDLNVDNSNLILRYRDSGRGISRANISKIFNPFFTTNREDGGSGLGLNIIYNIVTHLLKGSIECKSEELHGTEFIITVPFIQRSKK